MQRFRVRVAGRVLLAAAMSVTLAACTRGCAGKEEAAFCDAVTRGDAAAARALLDSGRVNVLARNFSGTCQPLMLVFQAAKPQSLEFTEMAISLATREGIANACWTSPATSSGRSNKGSTLCPIQVAANNANPRLMRALIDGGVDVKNQTARGALVDAVANGPTEMVRMLVEAGADPSAGLPMAITLRRAELVAYLEGRGGREPNVTGLLIAARQGDLAAIDAAIARGDDLEAKDGAGRTPLMRAAHFGHADAVTRLAKAGASVEHTVEGHTSLHDAANDNNVPVIQALVAAHANLNARAGASSPTPLISAVENGAVNAVNALVDAKADANVAIDTDTTAVVRAIELGNLANVRALLRGGARVNEARGTRWQPPIHASLGICGLAPEGEGENDYYRVTLLKTIVAAGAVPTAKNKDGRTPIEVVTALLSAADRDFYRACYTAKLDYLRSVS
jgi:ankyrin repeat protein